MPNVISRLAQFSTAIRVKNYGSLTYPICAVVQLATQPPGVIHQVILDPAKTKAVAGEIAGRTPFLIRLGEWPGDEARGWQYVENIAVLAVLGRASLGEGDQKFTVTVTPEEEKGVS